MNKVTVLKWLLFLFLFLIAPAHNSYAQNSSPAFPPVFDRSTVARLIQTIDTNYNAAVLKAGYFVRQRRGALPVEDGLKLVREQAKREKVASRRWVMLQSLRAFGGLRHSAQGRTEALAVYGGIFDRTPQAIKSGASQDVLRALNDFVSTVPSVYVDTAQYSSEPNAISAEASLLKGLRAWWRLDSPRGAWEPDWEGAIVKLASEEKPYGALVDAALKDSSISKNAGFYRTAALALYRSNTGSDKKPAQRALEFVDIARTKMPAAQREDIVKLLDLRVDILSSLSKATDSAATLRERIQLTGAGRDRLVLLLLEHKDDAGAAKALAELQKPDAKESEILNLAEALFAMRSDYYDEEAGEDAIRAEDGTVMKNEATARPRKTPEEKAKEKQAADARAEAAHVDAANLLQSYLSAQRPRALYSELRARLALGNYLNEAKKSDEARIVLDISRLKMPARDAYERETWDAILILQKSLSSSPK